MNKTILSVSTNKPIPYSFRKITYRQYRKAIDLLEESREAKRDDRDRLIDEAAAILIDNSTQLLDEAENADVQSVLTAAIEAQQGTEADAKKSESPH